MHNGPCYFGEYPLFFAACSNQKSVIEYLLKNGANLDVADSNGNNILHLCVIHNLTDMYSYLIHIWENMHPGHPYPLSKRSNNAGLTPFGLAAYLNLKDVYL